MLFVVGLLDHRIEPDFALGEIVQLLDQHVLDELGLETLIHLGGDLLGQLIDIVFVELLEIEIYRANVMTKMRATSLSDLIRMTLAVPAAQLKQTG